MKTWKILIIDDSEVNLYLIQTIFLDDPSITIEIESNSLNALTKIREGKPDIIILDLMMPQVDGFQLLSQVREEEELKNIPVMVISARHDEEAKQRISQLGILDYIKKPIDLQEIENKIRGALKSV
ncbi:MAG: response regulator [Bacteroidales bacterium]|nr:response regulator [Bacteroidales bacterium]MBN2817353.1 response regulator [Bacteroidales bacterium]